MFNFLFDGKIGDILAPVVPTNQLFLAIQHFKNDQISNLLITTGYDATRIPTGEYSAIHVACRYNNRVALDILISRGTSLQLTDQNGNTPLHYAAKYGHLDLCKLLIERGCPVETKNKQQQTAYDVAESHLIRQYLLPLVLQAERGVDGNVPPPPVFTSQPTFNQTVATSSYSAPTGHQQHTVFPPFSSNQQLPTTANGTSSTTTSNPQNPSFAPPPYAYNNLQVNRSTTSNNGASRIIQPDGFHSSASDPVLQQKYGHIIERPSVAPPPTGPPMTFTNYNSNPQNQQAGNLYNRYVPYDINQPPQIAHPAGYNQTLYAQQFAPQQPAYPAGPHPPLPVPSPNRVGVLSQPPLPNQQVVVPASVANNGTPVNRLLANKAIPIDTALANESVSPMVRNTVDSPSHRIAAFSRDEGDIIQASSNSNSIL